MGMMRNATTGRSQVAGTLRTSVTGMGSAATRECAKR
jgi:hypothetical protein